MTGRKVFKYTSIKVTGASGQKFNIYDDNGIVGTLLVKPSCIAWKKGRSQGKFKAVWLEDFIKLAEDIGEDISR